MKKIALIIILLIPLLGKAQAYNFNLLTRYVSTNGFYKENIVYSNKANDSYFLRLYLHNSKYKAILIDLYRLKQHFFKVTESYNDKNEIFFKFDYLNTNSITMRKDAHIFNFKFDVKKIDSTFKIVEMKTLKHKKKIISKATLKIKTYPYNMFSLFRFSNLHPYEYNPKMKYDGTGLIESYVGIYKKDTISIKLDFYEELDFELKVEKN